MDVRYLFIIKFLVKKCFSLSFELMKSNFTTVVSLEKFFRPLHGKIQLVCALIIITPKSPIPM